MVYAQNSVGCITEDSVEIISPPPISLSVPNDTIICQGSSIQLDAICQGGVGGYVYHWNNGSISQSVNVSPTSFQNYCVAFLMPMGVKPINCVLELICTHHLLHLVQMTL